MFLPYPICFSVEKNFFQKRANYNMKTRQNIGVNYY